MENKENKTCCVIGSGVSGLGVAIRMRNKGYNVSVYESNSFAGGKLSQEFNNGYRFDMGPSVFTMPEYVDELFTISGKNPRDYFNYTSLNPVYNYFFEDKSLLQSYLGKTDYAAKMAEKTSDSEQTISNYLSNIQELYNLTAEVFLHNSLHKVKNYFTKSIVKGVVHFNRIKAFSTMNKVNERTFKDNRLVQIFNRYATYNGSSPYLAPATLNVISYLEIIKGAYYPGGGMNTITQSLVKLAKDIGVDFVFSSPVDEIIIENKKAIGIISQKQKLKFDVVISNMDVYNTYHKLLPNQAKPTKTLNRPKSSSGLIFYWGIKKSFSQLRLHNILFTQNCEEEFKSIFEKKTIYNDPTIYINITAKHTPTDAPEGCENWFTMINVPNNCGQNWDELIAESRKNIIAKINRLLGIDIVNYIQCEKIFDPRIIETRTSSHLGAIYGNASNDKFAAFMRHPNYSKNISNLYFCGGSVHPGPSIPLCLLSAKITADLVK